MIFVIAYKLLSALLAIFGFAFMLPILKDNEVPDFAYRKMRIALWIAGIGLINIMLYGFIFPDEPKEINIEQHTCKYCHKVEYKIIKE